MRLLMKVRHLAQISKCSVADRVRVYSNSNSSPDLPTLTLYTKEECSLCDEAKEHLRPYAHRYNFEEVDIQKKENRKWLKYKYDIPVFHFNGEFLMKHKANIPVLLEALEIFEKTPK